MDFAQRQVRQACHRTGHIEELRVGVDVGREARVAVPHRGLRRPQRDARLRQVRAKGVAQGVDVDRAAAVVCLDDDLLAVAGLDAGQPGEDQVAVEDADESFG